jgi:hypothetical protein
MAQWHKLCTKIWRFKERVWLLRKKREEERDLPNYGRKGVG